MVDKALFNGLSIRQMQVFSALCLKYFCCRYDINHKFIDELVNHMASIATTSDLAEWDRAGTLLELAGRGDSLPNSVVAIIPSNLLETFSCLVESCVEVGIVDMYGAATDNPKRFLYQCVDILEQFNVSFPDVDIIKRFDQSSDVWGELISKEKLEKIFV